MARGATWVGAVFYTQGRERPVRKIVLHWMATDLAGCDRTFTEGIREASAHYGLEDGKRHQYVKESDTAWHAGNRIINHESISVEHSAQPGRNASEATVLDSIALCTDLCRDYGLTADDIHVHNEFYATQCPGTLPVARIRAAVAANLTTPKDWFDMATQADLRAAVKAELNDPDFLRSVARFVATGYAFGPTGEQLVLAGHLTKIEAAIEAVGAATGADPDAWKQAVKDALKEGVA